MEKNIIKIYKKFLKLDKEKYSIYSKKTHGIYPNPEFFKEIIDNIDCEFTAYDDNFIIITTPDYVKQVRTNYKQALSKIVNLFLKPLNLTPKDVSCIIITNEYNIVKER